MSFFTWLRLQLAKWNEYNKPENQTARLKQQVEKEKQRVELEKTRNQLNKLKDQRRISTPSWAEPPPSPSFKIKEPPKVKW
ncbi:hypothetical protein KY314_05210 [Candidatus Woesearchaeota archaeon]|nr:hypothetical protein [Candidatus Woesearchaeota archaeon]